MFIVMQYVHELKQNVIVGYATTADEASAFLESLEEEEQADYDVVPVSAVVPFKSNTYGDE
ncbi:hypothetical protein [Xanthomonas phage vB_XooS_NR08]|nr:hypothetical protein [Xanthomonas phage vB_XooS_NR08]